MRALLVAGPFLCTTFFAGCALQEVKEVAASKSLAASEEAYRDSEWYQCIGVRMGALFKAHNYNAETIAATVNECLEKYTPK